MQRQTLENDKKWGTRERPAAFQLAKVVKSDRCSAQDALVYKRPFSWKTGTPIMQPVKTMSS
ncbi:hypothetical protein, partial [Vibrio parahaemolyticus]|uniref:hypothetical protein n=1 Tax=Vibrio parahaemolyticus TaxID=670 RepID=UPI001A90865C